MKKSDLTPGMKLVLKNKDILVVISTDNAFCVNKKACCKLRYYAEDMTHEDFPTFNVEEIYAPANVESAFTAKICKEDKLIWKRTTKMSFADAVATGEQIRCCLEIKMRPSLNQFNFTAQVLYMIAGLGALGGYGLLNNILKADWEVYYEIK
jgi:hypothetical protein